MTTQSNSIQYAYAFDSQGTLTHISHAQRLHAYICPGCKSLLTPVLGVLNAWHFRHSKESCALETYLHKCAKEAFFYCYQQALNSGVPIKLELERSVSCNGVRLALLRNKARQCQKYVPARYNLIQFFELAQLEKRDKFTGLQPDIMLCDGTGESRCYVEICVTHPCSQEKINTGIPIIEFKVQSAADIQMLLSGSYSIDDTRLSVFNWHPESRTVNTCSGVCSLGYEKMSVWSLSDTGRLIEQTMPLADVDIRDHTDVNAWPKSSDTGEIVNNLQIFLRQNDPYTIFPNCIMCKQAGTWKGGYLHCRSKAKQVPYTEARQCASYEVEA